MDQPKIERLLRLMKCLFLEGTNGIDKKSLLKKMGGDGRQGKNGVVRDGMSDRTLKRYFATLRECGYIVTYSRSSKKYTMELDKGTIDFRQEPLFSEDEANELKSLVNSMDKTKNIKEQLLEKLDREITFYAKDKSTLGERELDCFGHKKDKLTYQIKLQMSGLAKRMLVRMYPSAIKNLKSSDDNDCWILETTVFGLDAPTNFVLGFFEDIKIEGENELKVAVRKKLKKISET